MPVEADQESGDDVEFLARIGKRNKSLDSGYDSLESKQLGDFREHRRITQVETEHVVAEQAANVEKIPGAAAEIENPFGRRNIEFELANASNVDVDPTLEMKILRPVRARTFDRVTPPNLLELFSVDRLNDAIGLKWKPPFIKKSTSMIFSAGQSLAAEKFLDLVTEAHTNTSHDLARDRKFN